MASERDDPDLHTPGIDDELEWRPVQHDRVVDEWVGYAEEDDEDELLVADLPDLRERVRRAWHAAWEREHEAGTAFMFAPLAFAVGIVLYFAAPVEPVWWVSLPLVPAAFLLARGRTGAAKVATAAIVLVVVGFAAAQLRVALVATPTLSGPTVGVLTAQVQWTERKAGGAVRYTLRVEGIEARRPVELRRARVTVRKPHHVVPPGGRLELRARLVPPSGPVTPGGYDFGFFAWFGGRGADGIALGVPRALPAGPIPVTERLAAWRYAIGERIAAGMDVQTGPLAKALIIGDRSGIADETAEDLRASGLAHILAISGMHMMLVTGLVFAALRKGCSSLSLGSQRVPVKKYAAGGAFLFATGYLFLSGMNVSTQRAYAMVCVMLLAVAVDRRALTLHNVAIAAFAVLVLQPEAVFSPGFQMSFGAATALITAYAALLRWRRGRDVGDGAVIGGARWLGGLSLTSLIAGFATAPFAAFHFHRIASYGLVANLLAMPVVTFLVMPLAVLSVLLMPLGMEAWVLPLLGWSLDAVTWVSGWVAGWEGWMRSGHVGTPAFLFAVAAFCTLALLRTWLRGVGLVFATAAAVAYIGQPTPTVLLHADGRHAAILGDRPTYFAGKPTSFVNKLFAEAHRPAGFDEASKARCDRAGCAERMDEGWLVLSRQPDGLPDDCRRASILVTWKETACRDVTDPPFVISRNLLREQGSIAIYDRGASLPRGERWQAVSSGGPSPRPWTAHRFRSQW